MLKQLLFILFTLLFLVLTVSSTAQARFPKPEFETGYEQPTTEQPEPRSQTMEYFDVLVLLLVMSLAAYFVLKLRSRRAVLWLSVFSLIYFGFYRLGCVCSVGSIQNVAYSLFGSDYAVSWTIVAFFALPLIFALFFGRVFCAAACPLGVIQDLVHIKTINVPSGLQKALALFPFLYLAFAILFAATGSDFIICQYDPFIGIYRLGGSFHMIVLGISFLLIAMFVGRPYCRFVCPYAVLLKWTSGFSKYHMTITPDDCINCRLCENSCPFDAIDIPAPETEPEKNNNIVRKFVFFILLIPVLTAAGGYLLSEASPTFSKVNDKVSLAEMLSENPDNLNETQKIDLETFKAAGQSKEELIAEATEIRNKFYIASWFTGGFIGLVLALTLLSPLIYRRHKDYKPNKGDCYSCGRCIKYCPVEKSKEKMQNRL